MKALLRTAKVWSIASILLILMIILGTIALAQQEENFSEDGIRQVDVIAPPAQKGRPGDTVYYAFKIINQGSLEDTYRLTLTSESNLPTGQVPAEIYLAPGSGATISVYSTLPLAPDFVSDQLTLTAASVEYPTVHDADAVVTQIEPRKPAMRFTSQVDKSVVIPGEYVTYTLEYENTGNVPLLNVLIEDRLPEQLTFATSSIPVRKGAGNTVQCPLQSVLYPEQKGVFTITAQVNNDVLPRGQIVNTAILSADGLPEPIEGKALAAIEAPHPIIKKSPDESEALLGDILLYEIVVSNDGVGAARAVTITELFPAVLKYISGSSILNGMLVSDPQWIGEQQAIWEVGDLLPGDQVTLRYQVSIDTQAKSGIYRSPAAVQAQDGSNRTLTMGTTTTKVLIAGRIKGKTFAQIEGVIFEDLNGNGAHDPDEPGIPEMEVMLIKNREKQRTNAYGEFVFREVEPGEQAVGVYETNLPEGFRLTTEPTVFTTLEQGGMGFVEFGLQSELAMIAGVVYYDMNGNGRQEPGEPGIANARLNKDAAALLTDSTGRFSARYVGPGTHTITLNEDSLPSRYQVSVKSSQTFSVKANERKEIAFAVSLRPAAIAGTVFLDANQNGVFDEGEPGKPRLIVELRNAGTSVQAVSDESGRYNFENIPPGAYTAHLLPESLPLNYRPTGNLIQTVVIAPNQEQTLVWGITPITGTLTMLAVPIPTPLAASTELPTPTPEVAEESPAALEAAGDLGDACVYIVAPGDILSKLAGRFTGNPGNYVKIMEFNNATTGDLKVGEELKIPKSLLLDEYKNCQLVPPTPTPTPTITPTPAPTLPPTPTPTPTPLPPGAVEGRVYYDRNANGAYEEVFDVPIPGVTLKISSDVRTTVTDEDGYYRFDNIANGGHLVWIDPYTLPTLYTAADAQPTLNVSVYPGEMTASSVADFIILKETFYETRAAKALLCLDLNGNSACEQGEPGVIGVTVYDPPSLAVKIEQVPLPILPDRPVVFRVTLLNTGGTDAVTVTIKNTMPEGFINQDGTMPPTQTLRALTVPADGQPHVWEFTYTPTKTAGAGENFTVITFADPAGKAYSEIRQVKPFTIASGSLRVTKVATQVNGTALFRELTEPPAQVGDELTWTIRIANTGFSDVTDVVITDRLGSGLRFSDGAENPRQFQKTTHPALTKIKGGESVEIIVKTEVIACSGLISEVTAHSGCPAETECRTPAATAHTSVDLTIEDLALCLKAEEGQAAMPVEPPQPVIALYQSPEIVYAAAIEEEAGYEPVVWTIRVVNSGTVPAHHVQGSVALGTGLAYQESSWSDDQGMTTQIAKMPDETPLQGVSFTIAELAPGEMRTLTLTTAVAGCQEAESTLTTKIACEDAACQEQTRHSGVLFPLSHLTVATTFYNPLNVGEPAYVIVEARNTGLTPVYNIDLHQVIPPGLRYQAETTEYKINNTVIWSGQGQTKPTGSGAPADPYIWSYQTAAYDLALQAALVALMPDERIILRFRVLSDCKFTQGQLKFWATYANQCPTADRVTAKASIFNILANSPIVTITKTPAEQFVFCNSDALWTITVKNTAEGTAGSSVSAPYIWLKDTVGSAYNAESLTLTDSGGNPVSFAKRVNNVLYWEIFDLPPDTVQTYQVTAKFTDCNGAFDNAVVAQVRQLDPFAPQPDNDPETINAGCDAPVELKTSVMTTNKAPLLKAVLVPKTLAACAENVPVRIELTNLNALAAIQNFDLEILFPDGVIYLPNTTEVNGRQVEPTILAKGLKFYDNDPKAANLPDLPPSEKLIIEFEVNTQCTMNGQFSVVPQFENCCRELVTPGVIALKTLLQYPRLAVEIETEGGPFECGDNTIAWTINVTNTASTALEPATTAEMVRVNDTLGEGLIFSGTGSDFFEQTADDTQFSWDAGTRQITWEIGHLEPGQTRAYHLTTGLAQATCHDALKRGQSVEATWHCAAFEEVDENPATDEFMCSAGFIKQSRSAEVQPQINVTTTIQPEKSSYCSPDAVVAVMLEVPPDSNTAYNLDADLLLPAGVSFRPGDALHISATPAGNVENLADITSKPADGAVRFAFENANGHLADKIQPGTTITITFNAATSCFDGGNLALELAYQDCCQNTYSSGTIEQSMTPAYPDLSIAVERDKATPLRGDDVKYTLTVTNTGETAATYAQIRADLPEWLLYQSATPPMITQIGGGASSEAMCQKDGTTSCGACQGGFSEGSVRWEVKNLQPGGTWQADLVVIFNPPAAGAECNDADTTLMVSTLYGCPTNVSNWAFDNDACSDESQGCALKRSQELANRVEHYCSALGDAAWEDANRNGIQDDGETRLAGVTVELYDGATNTLLAAQTTDAAGSYRFDALMPGDYALKFPQLKGYKICPPDQGDDDAQDSDSDVTTGMTAVITLAPDEAELQWDAGYYQLVSLGNRVWFDPNDNGVQDGGEPGIQDVEVRLLDEKGTAISTTTTDSDGYYLFDNLVPGVYIVEIANENFAPNRSLAELISSRPTEQDPNADNDHNDNGIDDADPAVNGIRSNRVEVLVNVEPTAEPGPGTGSVDDDNSNLSVDFGFFEPVSLGNRIWFDANDNGLQDSDEPGIAGVEVQLWDNADNLVQTAVTDADGLYLFDKLAPGQYIIAIPQENFAPGQPLAELLSSRTTELDPNADVDLNDNGIDSSTPAATGIRSGVIDAAADLEPTEESGNSGSVDDNNSNLTVDFGFFAPVSLGNRVWFDANDNGLQDSDEQGIAGVIVRLLDEQGNPVKDAAGEAISTITDINGAYLFDRLVPGNYIVELPADNFAAGQALAELISSRTTELDPNADTDLNDNGIDSLTPAATGIRSGIIAVAADAEPIGEVDRSGSVDDNNSNLTVDFGFFEPVSLGNCVWLDVNNNGVQDDDERGIAGVMLYLLDKDGKPATDPAGTPLTTTTGENGYYLFDRLTPGEYRVAVPAENFQPGKPLAEMQSSWQTEINPNTDADRNDNGIDDAELEVNGIRSHVIALTADDEPTGETGVGSGSVEDDNSNLTLDFGFFTPVSVGNRVWLDRNDNGAQDADEPGIAGVEVRLLDQTGNLVIDFSGNPAVVRTDAAGYYLFENLMPGDYIVELPQENFAAGQPLADLLSSRKTEINPNVNGDLNDNGIDVPELATTGIRSNVVELTANREPIDEADATIRQEDDNNCNLTVDFGFFGPMSLGNRVWFDANDNGVQDAGEPGIAGVEVRLLDQDRNPVIDASGNALKTITDANGYYLFDKIVPGRYIIELPHENFAAGKPLTGLISSHSTEQDPNADGDSNDNGLEWMMPGISGVRSGLIDLQTYTEPTGEPESSGSVSDNNSNLTVDFGFFEPVSLGNRVWFDANDNGVQDDGESGIAGVTLLLLDSIGKPVLDPAGNAISATTDIHGYYVFDNLMAGQYIVEVPKENFLEGAPLAELISSRVTETDPNADIDLNDNGIDSVTPVETGLWSGVIDVQADAEPTGEPGSGGSVDDQSNNLTVDFGFFAPVSLGNRVWFDANDNGVQDADEPGIAGVVVLLLNKDGKPVTDAEGNAVRTTTDEQGRYLFDALIPGDYLIELPKENFAAGNPLAEAISSRRTEVEANADRDGNDNGIDDETPSEMGIRSGIITATANHEPTGEADPSGSVDDNNSNLTVDFGFFVPVSLGNRVWFDANDNGIQDADEQGIAGVEVVLLDKQGNLLIDVDGNALRTITDTEGYYLFDNLIPGQYIVELPKENFADGRALTEFISSRVTGMDPNIDGDLNDNGRDSLQPMNDGIRSGVAEVTVNGELTGEAGESGSVDDNNSNLTVDFGFFEPVSLGNRVWFDGNDNGMQDANEAGIAGVSVHLLDKNGKPVTDISGNPLTTVTDAEGYYLFDQLVPGEYVVALPGENFAAGKPLAKLISSRLTEINPNDDQDGNDNGLDAQQLVENGIRSGVVQATADAEPTGERALSSGSVDDNNSNLTVDFGFFEPVSLGNRVWFDANDNGTHDPDETGIAGAVVRLLDKDGNPVTDAPGATMTTTTDAQGYYLFEQLVPGQYVVELPKENFAAGQPLSEMLSSRNTEKDPNADRDGNDNGLDAEQPGTTGIRSGVIDVTNAGEPAGESGLRPAEGEDVSSNLTVDFGFFTPVSLGNRVWFDTNNNGSQDDGEQGISGVTLRLLDQRGNAATSPDGNALTTTTDANGYYLFDQLVPGQYMVELPKENFAAGQPLAEFISCWPTEADPNANGDLNDNGEDAPDPASTGIRSAVIDIMPDQEPNGEPGPGSGRVDDNNSNLTIDFGFFQPVSLGNRVWYDANHNGLQDADEHGIAGVEIALLDHAGNPVKDASGTPIKTTTDADGFYLFDRLAPGSYLVEIAPENFLPDKPLAELVSSRNTERDANANGDLNDNGLDDAGTVTLSESAGILPAGGADETEAEVAEVVFVVNVVRSSVVELRVNDEPTGESGPGPGSVDDNNSNLTVDFGFFEPVSLGNQVWFDANNNGVQDLDEPGIAGVAARLLHPDGQPVADASGNPVATITDADGYYLFDQLAAGDYIVEIGKENFAPGQPLAEHISSRPTEINPNANRDLQDNGLNAPRPELTGVRSGVIELTADAEPTGEPGAAGSVDDDNSNSTIDFGFFEPVSLGNRVWLDANDNGRQDAGESGIAGVVLHLLGRDGQPLTDAVGNVLAATTDAGGRYLFDQLTPGRYIVEIPKENFSAGGPLSECISSLVTEADPNADGAQNDNGLDSPMPAMTGIRSGLVELSADTEPLNEVDSAGSVDDDNSNVTIDFGFFEPVSLGNRVWLDVNNNGVQEADEQGIAGVLMQLLNEQGEPVSDASGSPTTAVTDAEGYYLFDRLVSGRYIVEIAPANFAEGRPLAGMVSSQATEILPDLDNDLNDNGLESTMPETTGIRSGVVEVLADREPLHEPGSSGSVNDDNSNLTVDFGFFKPVSISKRVWLDADENGVQDPVEPGIAGVSVGLLDQDGNPVLDADGNRLITTTDAEGNFRFEKLAPGEYRVDVLAKNFAPGGPLDELIQSRTTEEPGFIEPVSLGNRVWFDADNNGRQNAGEPGIAGVTLRLLSLNWTPVTDANGKPIMATTDAHGYYLFDRLHPGEYLVEIRKENFAAGAPLAGLFSSQPTEGDPNTDADEDDNGVNDNAPEIRGILSGIVNLQADQEPTGEPGPGSGSVDDDNSNCTVDFGFFAPVSLGNRVWLDANDNGFQEADEQGIAGVEVRLLASDGTPVSDELGQPTATMTDEQGYYLFDNIGPGQYIVELPQANFVSGQPLAGMISSRSSEADPNSDRDLNDNGIDSITPVATGIRSGVVDIALYSEPDGEPGFGSGSGIDANSNLTVDFGFFAPVNLGNQVWLDANRNGLRDADEQGIAGVEVRLFDSRGNLVTDADGNAVTSVTKADGLYLFEKIPAGEYIVELAKANFLPGKPLAGLLSTQPTELDPNADQDGNDNGLDDVMPSVNGVRSQSITLAANTEPVGERGEPGSVDDDNSNLTVDLGLFQP